MKLRKLIRLQFIIVAVIFGIGLTIGVNASRNSSGTYSLPSGNPVVSGTTISSTTHNTTMSDIATELTDSLSRSNKGAMLGNLELVAGADTCASPALTWDGDEDSGIIRSAADTLGICTGGSSRVAISSTGVSVTGSTTSSGVFLGPTGAVDAPSYSFTGDTNSGFYRIGADNIGVAIDGVKRCEWKSTGGTNYTYTCYYGMVAANASTDGDGVDGAGNGAGYGVRATGGATGSGLYATGGATEGHGAQLRATGTGFFGVDAVGSGAGGYGGDFTPGVTTGAAAETYSIRANSGGVLLSHTSLNSTTGVTNGLFANNIPKAWALITTAAGSPATVTAGFNIASVTCAASNLTVNIADDMSSASYAVMCNALSAGGVNHICNTHTRAAGSFVVAARSDAGATLDLCTANHEVNLVVFGTQ